MLQIHVLGDSPALADAVDAVFQFNRPGSDALYDVALLRFGVFRSTGFVVRVAAGDGE